MTRFPVLSRFFTPIMRLQWKGPNTTVTRPMDRLWRLLARTTRFESRATICPVLKNATTFYFAPKTQKRGSMHFQWEYASLSV